jgi:hypothetical protein
MRIRAALTEAQASNVTMDVVSVVLPQARILTNAPKRLATGTHAFVGKAGVEVEILDSLTNERLVAAVDERSGGKTFNGITDKWDDVFETTRYWADRLREKLAEFRAR